MSIEICHIYMGLVCSYMHSIVQCPRLKVIAFAASAKFAVKIAGKEKVSSGCRLAHSESVWWWSQSWIAQVASIQ